MTEKTELKERSIEFIESLVALCPAYNRVSRMLLDMRGRSTTETDMKYPELFQERLAPLFCDLFDITFGATISVSGFGANIANLVDSIEKILSSEKKRKILEQQLGVSLPNPCKDYVKLCVDALKEKDLTAAKLLPIIDEVGGGRLDVLLEEGRKRGLVIADKTQLIDHLSKLADLNLILMSSIEYASPSDKYRGYAKEFVT